MSSTASWLHCKWTRCSHANIPPSPIHHGAHESPAQAIAPRDVARTWLDTFDEHHRDATAQVRSSRSTPCHGSHDDPEIGAAGCFDRSSAMAFAITVHVRCVGVSPRNSTSTAWSTSGTHVTEPTQDEGVCTRRTKHVVVSRTYGPETHQSDSTSPAALQRYSSRIPLGTTSVNFFNPTIRACCEYSLSR